MPHHHKRAFTCQKEEEKGEGLAQCLCRALVPQCPGWQPAAGDGGLPGVTPAVRHGSGWDIPRPNRKQQQGGSGGAVQEGCCKSTSAASACGRCRAVNNPPASTCPRQPRERPRAAGWFTPSLLRMSPPRGWTRRGSVWEMLGETAPPERVHRGEGVPGQGRSGAFAARAGSAAQGSLHP